MRNWLLLMFGAGLALAGTDGVVSQTVAEVVVVGGVSPVALGTRAGEAYDPAIVERDVRALYATRRFDDVRVVSEPLAEGLRVSFQVTMTPRFTLRKVEIIPDSFPLKPRVSPGLAVDAATAQKIAQEYRRELEAAGYGHAEVTPELVVVAPSTADVRLKVDAGDRLRVGAVLLDGDHDEIGRKALQALRSRWMRPAGYSDAALQSDLARVQSEYVKRGFVDAVVRLDHTKIVDNRAFVTLAVRPGRRFSAQEDLCKCLHNERRLAERLGVVDFSARASVDESGALIATTERGRSFTIRRIDFEGNRKFSDASIRRNLLLNEAEVLDRGLLRKSLERLNRSAMFEPLNESNVDVRTDEHTGMADLRIRLRERKSGSWLLSGPVGPISLAGPARFTLASRLPSWGRSLLDLSSYYASLHLGPGQAVIALQRPFVPGQAWASGFAIAPQLGWKNMAAQYAGTQFRERFLPGDSLAEPPIPVTVQRADGETVMLCEAPGPRWPWLKRSVTMALQFGSMLAL